MKIFRFITVGFLFLSHSAILAHMIDLQEFSPEKQEQELRELETLKRSAGLPERTTANYTIIRSLIRSNFNEVRQQTIEFLLSEVKDMSSLLTSSKLSLDQQKELEKKHYLKEFPFHIQKIMFGDFIYASDPIRIRKKEHQQISEVLVRLGSMGLIDKSLQSDVRGLSLDFEARKRSHGPSQSEITRWVYAIKDPAFWNATGKEKDLLIKELDYMDSILRDSSYSKEQKHDLIDFWKSTKFDNSTQIILFEIALAQSSSFSLAHMSIAKRILQRLNRMGVLNSHFSSKMDRIKQQSSLRPWIRRCAMVFNGVRLGPKQPL